MRKWIRIEDEKPARCEVVLCYYRDGDIYTNSYGSGIYEEEYESEDGEIVINWDDNSIGVTHWMPLPNPPQS